MNVERYQPHQKPEWDAFVDRSKNGTFLFLRDYMDYHQHRFVDHSLLIRNEKDELVAVLPANLDGERLVSHGGLTFGGFLSDDSMKMPVMLQVFDSTLNYLKDNHISTFVYKTIPHIYHRVPAEEDRYALFLAGAALTRAGAMTVVDNRHPLSFQGRRQRGVKKARQAGLTVSESADFGAYWQILTERLEQAHAASPVHTLQEIELLRLRFPENIKLFACFKDAAMLGGVLIYESDRVARVQYIASNEQGRALAALDLVFSELLTNFYRQKPFFDFSTSDEDGGRRLNQGLIEQKEGFGGRTVALAHYEIQLSGWTSGALTGAMG